MSSNSLFAQGSNPNISFTITQPDDTAHQSGYEGIINFIDDEFSRESDRKILGSDIYHSDYDTAHDSLDYNFSKYTLDLRSSYETTCPDIKIASAFFQNIGNTVNYNVLNIFGSLHCNRDLAGGEGKQMVFLGAYVNYYKKKPRVGETLSASYNEVVLKDAGSDYYINGIQAATVTIEVDNDSGKVDSNNNTVTINNVYLKAFGIDVGDVQIVAGKGNTATTNGNKMIVKGAEIVGFDKAYAFGTFNGASAMARNGTSIANNNSVQISDNTILSDISRINGAIADAGSGISTANGNSLDIKDTTIKNYFIFQGAYSSGNNNTTVNAIGNKVKIQDSNFLASNNGRIYGGSVLNTSLTKEASLEATENEISICDTTFNYEVSAQYTPWDSNSLLMISPAKVDYDISNSSKGKPTISSTKNSITLKNVISDCYTYVFATQIGSLAQMADSFYDYITSEASPVTIENNSITIENVKLKNTNLYSLNHDYSSKPLNSCNKLIVKGYENVIHDYQGFADLQFVISNNIENYSEKTLLQTQNTTNLWHPNSVDIVISDTQKDALAKSKDPIVLFDGDNALNILKESNFSVNGNPCNKLSEFVDGDVEKGFIVGTKHFGFNVGKEDLNPKYLGLLTYGNFRERNTDPSYVYLNESGEQVCANPNNKTEMTLTEEQKDFGKIYAVYSDYSQVKADELAKLAPTITVNIDNLDFSNTSLYASNNTKLMGNLDIAAEGVKIKDISGFANYSFDLKSEYDGKTLVALGNTLNFDSEAKLNVNLDPDKAKFGRVVLVKNVGKKPTHSYIKDRESVLTITKDLDHFIKITSFAFDNEKADEIAIKETSKTYYADKHAQEGLDGDSFPIDKEFVQDTPLEDVEYMYGIYSDSGHAINEYSSIGSGVNLNWVNFYGGFSKDENSDSTTGNRIDFIGKGASFKKVANFQYIDFNANSDTKEALSEDGFRFLNTAEEIDLGKFNSEKTGQEEKKVVNFTADKFNLEKGERLVIMDKVKNKAEAEYRFDGIDMPALYVGEVEENGANQYVQVSDIIYDDSDENQVAVVRGDTDIQTAKFIDHKGNYVPTKDSTLIVNADSVSNYQRAALLGKAPLLKTDSMGFEHIYGGFSVNKNMDATNTTIKLTGNVNKTNTLYHGSYNAANDHFVARDNALEVSGANNRVKGITHFENMRFVLPGDVKSGATLLSATDKVDLTPTKSIKIAASAGAVESLKKSADSNQFVNLLTAEGKIEGYDDSKVTTKEVVLSSFTDITAKIGMTEDSKSLQFLLKANDTSDDEGDDQHEEGGDDQHEEGGDGQHEDDGKPTPKPAERTNSQTKAPVEAVCAASALVNSSNDLIAGELGQSMATLGKDGLDTFAAMAGGKTRLNSGSHIDTNAWNIGVGIAKKGLSKKNPNSTYGIFFSYGKSRFDTYNGDCIGNGKTRASGLGFMFHSIGKNNYYYNGSAFLGKVKTDWNSVLGGYSDDATFRGFNLTMGHKHELNSNKVLDTYAKYMFSHTNAMNAKMGAYEYNFEAVESSRLRLGFRVECGKEASKFIPFYGLAYEREFNGDAKASMNLGRVDSPSLKGDTGILEAGCKWTRGAWDFNFTVEGSIGKRQGVTGSFNAYYNF